MGRPLIMVTLTNARRSSAKAGALAGLSVLAVSLATPSLDPFPLSPTPI